MLERFFYGEMPGSSDLKEMILRMAIGGMTTDDSDYSEYGVGRVVRKLISAYWTFLEMEDEDQYAKEMKAACENGKEAEELFFLAYRKAYAQEWAQRRRESRYSSIITEHTDEDMDLSHLDLCVLGTYDEGYVSEQYPRWLIVKAAKAKAADDCRSTIAWAEWNIKAGIPGTKEHRELLNIGGVEHTEQHVQKISERLAAGAANG